MNMKKLTGMIAAFALGGIMLSAAPASAVTTDCSLGVPDASGKVTPNAGCEFSDRSGASQPTLTEVNAENFFGISDWSENGKIDTDDGAGTNGSLTISGTDINDGGSWSISGFDSSLTYMLLFKDGSSALPSTLIGYLITTATGAFDQVFSNCSASGCVPRTDAISNIRLFSSTSDPNNNNPIPLPAAGFLLLGALGALGGLGAYRRRQTAA